MNFLSVNRAHRASALLLVAAALVSGNVEAQVTVEYLHTDALGSLVAVTDQAGAIIDRNDYEPYGSVIGEQSYQGVGYTGHVHDSATALTYMQQRYYDQQLGLFLSVDPVTASSNPVGQFHRYRYANNSPYRFIDPDGRVSDDPARQPRGSLAAHSPSASSFMKLGSGMGGAAQGAQKQRGPAQSGPVASPSSGSTAGGDNGVAQVAASTAKAMADANGMIAGTAQNHLVSNGSWRGANGKMYNLEWGGNQHTGARSLVLAEANAFKLAGQGFFVVSSGISLYEGVGALQNGDGYGATKAGVDITWGAAATFGGPVGLVGGAVYSGTSFLVTIPSVKQYTVDPATNAMCWIGGTC